MAEEALNQLVLSERVLPLTFRYLRQEKDEHE